MNQSDKVPPERLAVGIDLGATYSAIAYVDQHGRQSLIPNRENERLTPSKILFAGQRVMIGSMAPQTAIANRKKLVGFIKREMGKSKTQFHREFKGRKFSAEELSALIIGKLRNDAEKLLGRAITDAVISVPAYFNDSERSATVRAGKLAGLNVIGVLNEPTAAALAYDFRQSEGKQTVLVFDLGGGGVDVTIMEIADNEMRVLANHGDRLLGGKDWDDLICSWVAEAFKSEHGENPMLDRDSYEALYGLSIVAKEQLSSRESVNFDYSSNGRAVRLELTRAEFEERSRSLIERCKRICEMGLAEARLAPSQIDGILLAGGMTHMPSVRAMLAAFSPGVPLADFVSPNEVVALGAATQANLKLLQEEDLAGARTIPDEVRGQFSGDDGKLIKVSDITTHTLGMIIWDHALQTETVHAMIHRCTRIPASVTKTFGLSKDNLSSMDITVVEGESSLPAECSTVCECKIEVPPGLPRGTPVSITFSYTECQLVEIAVEIGGQPRRARLTRSLGVPKEDLTSFTADVLKMEIGQSARLSSRRPLASSARTTDPGGTSLGVSPRRPESGYESVSTPGPTKRIHRRRIPRDILVTLAAVAVVVLASGTWFGHLVQRNALLSAEVAKLGGDWRDISTDLDDAQVRRKRATAFLERYRQIAQESDREKWTPALRSIAASAGPDIELRVIHLWKNPDDPLGRILRIEGFSTGLEPRAVADRFALQLHEELSKFFQASEGCRFERLDDEQDALPSQTGRRRAVFTIVAVIGAALPTKAPDNLKK